MFYFDELNNFRNAVINNPETCFYETFFDKDKKVLVEYRGFEVAYLSPTRQLSVLLIDLCCAWILDFIFEILVLTAVIWVQV